MNWTLEQHIFMILSLLCWFSPFLYFVRNSQGNKNEYGYNNFQLSWYFCGEFKTVAVFHFSEFPTPKENVCFHSLKKTEAPFRISEKKNHQIQLALGLLSDNWSCVQLHSPSYVEVRSLWWDQFSTGKFTLQVIIMLVMFSLRFCCSTAIKLFQFVVSL